jgi:hypothetical protein
MQSTIWGSYHNRRLVVGGTHLAGTDGAYRQMCFVIRLNALIRRLIISVTRGGNTIANTVFRERESVDSAGVHVRSLGPVTTSARDRW